MKRAVFFSLSGIVALAGCRALVGIDDLEQLPPDAGKQTPNVNKNDGGGSSGGPEAGPGPTFDIAKCLDTNFATEGCQPCCKKNIAEFKSVFEEGTGGACVCEKSTCKDKCSAGICASPPQPGPPQDACAMCEDDFLAGPSGDLCKPACNGNANCELALQCLKSCRH